MNTMNHMIQLHTEPNMTGLVDNLASNYDNLGQAINELIDNSISDFRAHPNDKNPHLIRVSVEDAGLMVKLRIEDTGKGITDLGDALSIAGKNNQQTPLNEHGQGLNQALAYIGKNGGDWSLATRTEDNCRNNEYLLIRAPRNKLDGVMEAEVLPGWDGELSTTGTIEAFAIPSTLFATLDLSVNEAPSFTHLTDLLAENLRFTYSQILKDNDAAIELVVVSASGKRNRIALKPLEPNWKEPPKTFTSANVDLGNGPVTITGRYGSTLPSDDCVNHFRSNLATSGAIISINGRVIAAHLLTGIWKLASHPSLNSFTLILDISSDNLSALPETTPQKTGFRAGDPRLAALFRYIRSTVNPTQPPRGAQEREFLDKLAAQLEKEITCMSIEREQPVFSCFGLKERADLIYSDVIGGIHIWEGKAKKSRILDLYQLRMYIDGKVHDGVSVLSGVLIAKEHPDEVRKLVAFLNTQEQEDGNTYNIRLETWSDYGIS